MWLLPVFRDPWVDTGRLRETLGHDTTVHRPSGRCGQAVIAPWSPIPESVSLT